MSTNSDSCSLNELFHAALKRKRFKDVVLEEFLYPNYPYKHKIRYLIDSEFKDKKIAINSWHSINCCGITEAIFEPLQEFNTGKYNKEDLEELFAKYIKANLRTEDKRVLIIGCPVSTPHVNSSYNMKFYKKVVETLKSFGFKQVNDEPYKNQNSSNDLVVLIGQMS